MGPRRISRNVVVFGLWGLAALILIAFQYIPTLFYPARSISHVKFEVLWTQPIKKLILTTPVIIGDVLVYGTYDGFLVGISKKDGRELWAMDLKDSIFAISKDSKTVYAGTGSHFTKIAFLVAVDPITGIARWKRQYEGHIEEPLAVDEQARQLWTGSGPSSLWSASVRDGSVLWHKEIGHLDATPLLHEGVLYVPAQKEEGLHESFFYALDAKGGDILWKIEQPGQPWASPILDKTGGVILTTTGVGQIGLLRPTDKGWAQAVSIQGRNVLWETALPNMPMTPGVYLPAEDILIYTTKAGIIAALNAVTGDILWHVEADTEFSSQAVAVDRYEEKLIAATSGKGNFYLIDVRDGKILYERKMGYRSSSAPVIDGNVIYITTGHNITALGEVRGR